MTYIYLRYTFYFIYIDSRARPPDWTQIPYFWNRVCINYDELTEQSIYILPTYNHIDTVPELETIKFIILTFIEDEDESLWDKWTGEAGFNPSQGEHKAREWFMRLGNRDRKVDDDDFFI